MLTALELKGLKPKDKNYREADKDGLCVLVQVSGIKLFQYRYRFDGKGKIYSHGRYPDISLEEARIAHAVVREQVRQGIDPMASKKKDKDDAKEARKYTFESVANDWHKAASKRWIPSHSKRVWRDIELNLLPSLGKLTVASITTPILLRTIKRIEDRGAVDVAQRAVQKVTSILQYAIQHGLIEHNAGWNLKGVVVANKEKHREAVSVNEIPQLVSKIYGYTQDNIRGKKLTELALKLTLHTFLRSAEIRGARWSEIDLAAKQWIVPAIRNAKEGNGGMKMKIDHIVPLSPQSIKIIKDIQKLGLSEELVFPIRQGAKTIMSENTMNQALNKMGYKGKQTVHGFRTLYSTVCNAGDQKNKWSKDAIERQLAHSPASGDSVRDAYNRYEYLDERVKLMNWWSNYIDSKVSALPS